MKIGIVGYTRSGKDTVGELMFEYLIKHGKTRKLALGDSLSQRFYEAFPEAKTDKKPREWFETFGELGRQIDKNLWINSLSLEIRTWSGFGYENFIVTDIRQPNEAKWARENGFTLVSVLCPPKIRQKRSKDDTNWQPVNHSERFLHEIETYYGIVNDSDLKDLQNQVNYIMEELTNGN